MLHALALLVLAAPGQASSSYSVAWDKVQSAIETRYYARGARKAEMERLLAKYGPRAKGATSDEGFEAAVNSMIGEFKDSHFELFTKDDQGFYLMDGLMHRSGAAPMPEVGAWFKKDGPGYQVRMVLDGGEAQKAGLRKGDIVTLVDGKPFTPVASIQDKVGQSVHLTVDRDGTMLPADVRVQKEGALEMFLDASRDSARIIDRNGKKIGYFHLWTQANDDFKNALSGAVYGKLKDTDAFILDLRDGFGGRPEGYADPFYRPEAHIEWKTSPTQGMTELFGYARPLVVLINDGSRSAKEVLSFIIKKSHRAVLVGSTTAGNVLGTFPMRVNDWSYLEIPMVDVVTDGVRLEGKGVSPDLPVPQEYDSNGNDLVLAAAVDKLAGKGSR
jgi:carboxyl-terminal processing protease